MNDIEKVVRLLEFADTGFPEEKKRKKNWPLLLAAAACAALILALAFPSREERMPVDTFESPELAYAKAESIFAHISGSIDKCMNRAQNAYQKITNTDE